MEYVILYNRFMDKSTQIPADAYFNDIENLYLDQKDWEDMRSGGIASLLRSQLGLEENFF